MTRISNLAIIGGTGLGRLPGFGSERTEMVATPLQQAPVAVQVLQTESGSLRFLPRHGAGHELAPHQINYRANLHALHLCGVTDIIAVNAVGGIHGHLGPGSVAIPEQLIDYTFDREMSFVGSAVKTPMHIEFTQPYSADLRHLLLHAVAEVNENSDEPTSVLNHGVYGCTQGPRLETAAEIQRLKRDGCDMVGMTGMPEAVLARELGIRYASLALSVNWGAGLGMDPLSMDAMQQVIDQGMGFIRRVLLLTVSRYHQQHG